jgi:acetate kinase
VKCALPCILTINGGSSSIWFAVYEAGDPPRRRLNGKIERIGLRGTNLIVNDPAGKPQVPRRLGAADHRTAAGFLLNWLGAHPIFASVKAVGHRVVHGMKHSEPERVTPKLLAELHRITSYDPDHLPREIALIEAFRRRHPRLT